MPDNTTQQPQMQGQPQQPSQDSHGVNPEKMLIQMLKEMEQNIMDLSQRLDVLEQKEQTEPAM